MERGRQSRGLFALYGAVFLAAWAFLFWKCRFGFGNIDESFYLTVPYRLCRGDTLLLHEWHLSQTSGFLLVPAMRLFLLTHGSTAGILLWFRRLYTAVWGLAALFFCFRLRRFSLPGAMLGGIALGVIEQMAKTYISPLWADAIVFAVLVLVLVVRPTGLLGKEIQEKV